VKAELLPFSVALLPANVLASEELATGNLFFMQTTWIDVYVRLWPEVQNYGVIRLLGTCEKAGSVPNHLSYAWIGKARTRTALGFSLRTLGFNRSFTPELSSVTLEENGFFRANSKDTKSFGEVSIHESEEFASALDLLQKREDWDELQFDALSPIQAEVLGNLALRHGLVVQTYAQDLSYWVDCGAIRKAHAGDYLATRSANSRQQFRRARRAAEKECGELKLETADSLDTALQWLRQLGELHQLRWKSDDPHEGFNANSFREFNESLTSKLFASDLLMLHRISAGNTVLGYLYNIRCNGRIHFLMSGIQYDGTESYKPGLLCHWLAIDQCIQDGNEYYDFLKGSSRYKESLATHKQVVTSLKLRRRRLSVLLEHCLRRIKNRLLSRREAKIPKSLIR
jgi:Acetyltransferase (GNAT) domain